MVKILMEDIDIDYEIADDDIGVDENLANFKKLENSDDKMVDTKKSFGMKDDVMVSK